MMENLLSVMICSSTVHLVPYPKQHDIINTTFMMPTKLLLFQLSPNKSNYWNIYIYLLCVLPTVYNALVCAYLKWCGGVRNSLVQLFTFGVAYVVEVNKKSLIVVQEDGKIYSNSIRSGTITLETLYLGQKKTM